MNNKNKIITNLRFIIKTTCIATLATISFNAHAEIYVVEDAVTIYGNGHHVSIKHHDKYASKHKRNSYSIYVNRENNYIPDMSTMDDNAIKNPGLQIN